MRRLASLQPINNIAGNRMTTSPCTSVPTSEQNVNLRLNPANVIQTKNGINIDQITQAMVPKAIDLIFRTAHRVSQEMLIIADLKQFLREHKFDLKVMPFGSTTYGFGGAGTDFNICLLKNGG